MAGIIEAQRGPVPEEDISPQSVRSQMKVPPQKQGSYAALVAAGKKLMYSPQMDEQVQALMAGEGDIGQKLGMGVVGIMALLLDRSNGTLPQDMLIPAALELVAEAAAMLREQGEKVTKQDIGEGMGVVVEEILRRAGVEVDQIPQLLGQGGEQEAPEGPEDGPADMAEDKAEGETPDTEEEA